jgi:MFS family permease
VVSGFFSGTLSTAQGFIADVSPPERRAKTMGYFGAAFSLGFAFGPVLGGLFAGEAVAAESFRLPIFIAGGLSLLASVWCFAVLRDAVPPKGKGRRLPAYSEAFRFVGGAAAAAALVRDLVLRHRDVRLDGSDLRAVERGQFRLERARPRLRLPRARRGGLFAQLVLIGPLAARYGEARVIVIGLACLALSMVLQPVIRTPVRVSC